MGKNVKLKDLSREVLISELQRCWEHFKVCKRVLDGDKSVKPVELFENAELGDMDDLELFYTCKKIREEKEYLEKALKRKEAN